MPRAELSLVVAVALAASGGARASALDPHLDRMLLPDGCATCHAGHGVSTSPMLPAPQSEVCLGCHDSRARADEQVARGRLAPNAQPALLGGVLALPYTHELTPGASSRFDSGAVTCTSCHSPHRGSKGATGAASGGLPKSSTRDPRRPEYELCESCHGDAGAATRRPTDLSRLFDPSSRSSHPVHAPSEARSPSLVAEPRRTRVACTDCHGTRLGDAAAGPHGSDVAHLLSAGLTQLDGAEERTETYALCYRCHDRDRLLSDASTFPLHRLHVVDERAACSTCHSAHGSIDNRALIRFGEESARASVLPSGTAGRLAFESDAAGSGTCYLTCHGIDHGPKGYGAAQRILALGVSTPAPNPIPTAPAAPRAGRRVDRVAPGPKEGTRQPPPPD